MGEDGGEKEKGGGQEQEHGGCMDVGMDAEGREVGYRSLIACVFVYELCVRA